MSIIDDQTVTLADLPVCIGYAPAAPNGKGRILMLAASEKISGFMVAGDIDTISVPLDSVFSMPGYLKTEVIDSCAVRDSAPIPIINVVKLCAHLVKEDQEPLAPALTVPAKQADAGDGGAGVRVFELSGDLFGATLRGIEDRAIRPGRIRALSLLPEYIRGITLHRNNILPVIDLCQRIKRQACRRDPLMVVAEIGGVPFGLLIDDDRGILPPSDVLISDLPPVAQTSWLSRTIIRSGELIPLADPVALLLPQQGQSGLKPQDQRYAPASAFHELFKRQDVEVIEFLLLGARHALPKSEVEDIIPFKSFRPIPDTPEIVVGIVEHNGTVLPVLDLAMVFGRRSLVKTEWSMILVRNGDFRALVVTEAVLGETRLSLDIQRAVPILLPHRVVYGCYPAADGVRLIMNVYAMTVHFERSLVKDLLSAMSAEMKMARAEIVHSLLDEQPVAADAAAGTGGTDSGQAQQPVAEATEQVPEMGVPPLTAAEDATISAAYKSKDQVSETIATGAPGTVSESGQQPAVESAEQVPDMKVEPVSVTEQAATSMAYEERSPEAESMTGAGQMGDAGRDVVPVQAQAETVEPAAESDRVAQQAEKQIETPVPAEATAEAPVSVSASEEVSTDAITSPQEVQPFDSEERPVKTEDETQPVQVSEETADEKPLIEIIQPGPLMPEQAVAREEHAAPAGAGDRVEQAEEPGFAEETAPEQQPVLAVRQQTEKAVVGSQLGETTGRSADVQPEPVQTEFVKPATRNPPAPAGGGSTQRPDSAAGPAGPSRLSHTPSDISSARRGKGGFWYAVAGAVLVALLSFTVFFKKSIPEKSAEESAPLKTEALKTEEGAPLERKKPPLELDVPASRVVVDNEIYTVVKGDTLWSISERFTGNPFNYPRIAGENKIANADLIFPGQKIRLLKK
jgi:chemotaxis signal transduction protein/nucleoid-associated protein YgaU